MAAWKSCVTTCYKLGFNRHFLNPNAGFTKTQSAVIMILGHSHCHFQPVKDQNGTPPVQDMDVNKTPQGDSPRTNGSAPETSSPHIYHPWLRWLLLYPRLVMLRQPHDACNTKNSIHLLSNPLCACCSSVLQNSGGPLHQLPALKGEIGYLEGSPLNRGIVLQPDATKLHFCSWGSLDFGEMWRWKQDPWTFSGPNHSNTIGFLDDACKGFPNTTKGQG